MEGNNLQFNLHAQVICVGECVATFSSSYKLKSYYAELYRLGVGCITTFTGASAHKSYYTKDGNGAGWGWG